MAMWQLKLAVFLFAVVTLNGDGARADVSCGHHRASNCGGCPGTHGESYCNGDCRWCYENGDCQMKGGPCAVNGKWGEWSEFGTCSTTCGSGIRGRSRPCTNPPPSNGGSFCAGSPDETQSCNVARCPAPIQDVSLCEGKRRTVSCGSNEVIKIVSTNYGRLSSSICPQSWFEIKNTHCRSRYSQSEVRNLCHGVRSCSLYASNSIFGDPCFGTRKYLGVKYQCVPQALGGSPVQDVRLCENKGKTVSCGPNEVINIIFANYGRLTNSICPQSLFSIKRSNCRAAYSQGEVSNSCNAKSSCALYASNSVFGDPCFGTNKYLRVKYQCVPQA